MELTRYIIRPTSPWATPLSSDTLQGLLLCRIAEQEGERAVRDTIEAFLDGDPPYAVSSVMEKDTICMPVLPGLSREQFQALVDQQDVFVGQDGVPLTLFEALQARKTFRKRARIPLSLWKEEAAHLSFQRLLAWYCREFCVSRVSRTGRTGRTAMVPGDGASERDLREKIPGNAFRRNGRETPFRMDAVEPHVTIERQNGTSQTGGLFFQRLTWYDRDAAFHLYVRTRNAAQFLERLRLVGLLGFGRDASTGKGQFVVEEDPVDRADVLPDIPDSRHHLLCSVCASMNQSSLSGWYTVLSKSGKAGAGFGFSPFKAPVLLLAEGSVLRTLPEGPYVLSGIHQDPRVVQITEPFTLPCNVVEDRA